jgi:hypothetical protein
MLLGVRDVKTRFACAMLACIALPRCILALPPHAHPQDDQNAAVKILRANVSLRQSFPLAPNVADTLEAAIGSPLNAGDKKIVASAGDALTEFEHATRLKRCNWAMSFEDGPFANTSQRGAVRELVAIAALRARLRFRDAEAAGAITDALAALAGARDLSMDGTLASYLIDVRLEQELTDLLAGSLARLTPSELEQLKRGLGALPPGLSAASAFEAEKLRRNELEPIAQAAGSREDLLEGLLKGVPALRSNRKLAAEIVDGCGGTVAGFKRCVRQRQSFYAKWAPQFSLPAAEFEKTYSAEFGTASKMNPVIRMFTPPLSRLRWVEADRETRRALLRAAIAVRLRGESALKEIRDPYDGESFAYLALKDGFEVKSRLTDRGAPITLTVTMR